MIFVDTSAWFALVVPTDPCHKLAKSWLMQNKIRLITSDYVVDEILTLLKMRGEYSRALSLGKVFFETDIVEIYHLSETDILEAWRMFRDFSDKGWSFTDCSSKVIMDNSDIKKAFAFDEHFKQFGNINILPSS